MVQNRLAARGTVGCDGTSAARRSEGSGSTVKGPSPESRRRPPRSSWACGWPARRIREPRRSNRCRPLLRDGLPGSSRRARPTSKTRLSGRRPRAPSKTAAAAAVAGPRPTAARAARPPCSSATAAAWSRTGPTGRRRAAARTGSTGVRATAAVVAQAPALQASVPPPPPPPVVAVGRPSTVFSTREWPRTGPWPTGRTLLDASPRLLRRLLRRDRGDSAAGLLRAASTGGVATGPQGPATGAGVRGRVSVICCCCSCLCGRRSGRPSPESTPTRRPVCRSCSRPANTMAFLKRCDALPHV